MTFGICSGPENASALAAAGCAYLEVNVQSHLMPLEPEEKFGPVLAQLNAAAVRCTHANCFLPGALKVTGPAVDGTALRHYVTSACMRASRAGISLIVFGSGGARQIPDGFGRDTAGRQLLEFARMAGDIAGRHGVTIVVEPLNQRECNVFTSVAETAAFVRELNHPCVRLLVDAYHWARGAESPDDIVNAGALIAHTHIATTENRLPPGAEPCDFAPFFSALARTGYHGSVSIEARWTDLPHEAPAALAAVRAAAQ